MLVISGSYLLLATAQLHFAVAIHLILIDALEY